jgi:hypothetical protein
VQPKRRQLASVRPQALLRALPLVQQWVQLQGPQHCLQHPTASVKEDAGSRGQDADVEKCGLYEKILKPESRFWGHSKMYAGAWLHRNTQSRDDTTEHHHPVAEVEDRSAAKPVRVPPSCL